MSIIIDPDGTIYLYQGDSGELVLSGLDETKKHTVYFAIYDKNRKLVGEELQVTADNSSYVTFILTPEYTDLLTVPKNKPYEIYYYGLKDCELDEARENTLYVASKSCGGLNMIVVYPRKVAGGENGTR